VGNFDIDLDFGQIYEEKVRKLFEGEGSIEVRPKEIFGQILEMLQ